MRVKLGAIGPGGIKQGGIGRQLIVGLGAAALPALFVMVSSTLAAPPAPQRDEGQAAMVNSRLLSEVVALDQVSSLRLSRDQAADITRRLTQLDQGERAYSRQEEQAAKTVSKPLQRIRDALLAEKPPVPADQVNVRNALSPLDDQRSQLSQLRVQTIEVIRQELSRPQLDVVRVDVGIAPVGSMTPPNMESSPGSGWLSPGTGMDYTTGMNPDASAWFAANFNQMGNAVLRVLDAAHTLPALTYGQNRNALASQLAAASGANPNNPYFVLAQNNMANLLDQTRGLSIIQYGQIRQQMALSVLWQSYISHLPSPEETQAAAQAAAAVVASDQEAVGRFFLRPEVLQSLRLRTQPKSTR